MIPCTSHEFWLRLSCLELGQKSLIKTSDAPKCGKVGLRQRMFWFLKIHTEKLIFAPKQPWKLSEACLVWNNKIITFRNNNHREIPWLTSFPVIFFFAPLKHLKEQTFQRNYCTPSLDTIIKQHKAPFSQMFPLLWEWENKAQPNSLDHIVLFLFWKWRLVRHLRACDLTNNGICVRQKLQREHSGELGQHV